MEDENDTSALMIRVIRQAMHANKVFHKHSLTLWKRKFATRGGRYTNDCFWPKAACRYGSVYKHVAARTSAVRRPPLVVVADFIVLWRTLLACGGLY